MRKTFFLALLLALATPAAFAQTAPVAPAAKAPQYEHCILVLNDGYFDGRDVRLEFGQSSKSPAQNAELAQADAAVRKLKSVVAALNYMSSQGWECINVSTLSSTSPNPDTGYLLRRAK